MNWLQNIQFEIQIDRMQDFSFRSSKVTIPNIESAGPRSPTPFKHLPMVPDALNFGQLSITAGIDENMDVWWTMYQWIVMGTPDNFSQFDQSKHDDKHHSDISVIMLNSKKNPIGSFLFRNAIPVTLGSINLDTTQTAHQITEFSIDFDYDTYSFIRHK